jgi:hypothetical protein
VNELIINKKPPWWRRIACAIGWHRVYRSEWCAPLGEWMLQCLFCGTEDLESDWLGLRCGKSEKAGDGPETL